ncbi:MAG: hypothetical protein WBI27_05285 [Thermoanaerobaculia bacterium]
MSLLLGDRRLAFLEPTEPDEGAAVLAAEETHEGGEADTGGVGDAGRREHHREADGVDPDPAVALGVAAVEAVDGVDDLVDRLAGELVAKDIDRDLLVGGGEGADGAGDPLDRTRVAEDVPGSDALARS